MKYIKTAILSVLGAACLFGCKKTETFGPGTGIVNFGETQVMVKENGGLFTVPLVLSGEPGGYPVTVNITAETNGDIDDILLVTSNTVKITADNDSFVQMIPVLNRDSDEDYEVRLVIEDVTGASIGEKSQCTIFIENSLAVRYGQYNFQANLGDPLEWTLILREGANGSYIMENMFDLDYSPKMVCEYDEENNQLVMDGRVSGYTQYGPLFGQVGWGTQYEAEWLAVTGSGSSGKEPVIFNVNDKMELESTSSSFTFTTVNPKSGQQTLRGTFNGGKMIFAGENVEKPWPFPEN